MSLGFLICHMGITVAPTTSCCFEDATGQRTSRAWHSTCHLGMLRDGNCSSHDHHYYLQLMHEGLGPRTFEGPGFEKIINPETDRAGIFRNKKMIKEREEGKLRPDSQVNKAICASL